MRILGTVASSSREVPGAPTIGTATDVGTARAYNDGSATVTFTAPTFDGGLPITLYTVTSSPGGFIGTGVSSPVTVTGLQSSISYTFTVRATNGVGQSAASAASNSITATTVPQAPTIGTATAGDALATVAYTAGATGGKAVSVYTATATPGSLTGTGASPITVSGLTNGTAYTFKVKATNANGTSLESAASNSVTPIVPSAFDSIATITSTGSQTTLSFTSIPSTYKSLQIRYLTFGNGANQLQARFNGDSASNYWWHLIYGNGTNADVNRASAATGFIYLNATRGVPASTTPMVGIIDIIDYGSTTKNKTLRTVDGIETNGGLGGSSIELTSGLWTNTTAINQIAFTLDSATAFPSGSTFALYGVK